MDKISLPRGAAAAVLFACLLVGSQLATAGTKPGAMNCPAGQVYSPFDGCQTPPPKCTGTAVVQTTIQEGQFKGMKVQSCDTQKGTSKAECQKYYQVALMGGTNQCTWTAGATCAAGAACTR